MSAEFTPEDIKIYGDDGKLRVSDIWGLTCIQLGETITKLLEARPGAHITQDNLVGYHFINYGMDPGITNDVVGGLIDGGFSYWDDWNEATPLRNALPNILADDTNDALAHRIRLYNGYGGYDLSIYPTVEEYFDEVTERDHRNTKVVSLYPRDGVELEYRGRTNTHLGRATINAFVQDDIVVHTDILDLSSNNVHRTVVATSTNVDSVSRIQSFKVL